MKGKLSNFGVACFHFFKRVQFEDVYAFDLVSCSRSCGAASLYLSISPRRRLTAVDRLACTEQEARAICAKLDVHPSRAICGSVEDGEVQLFPIFLLDTLEYIIVGIVFFRVEMLEKGAVYREVGRSDNRLLREFFRPSSRPLRFKRL